MTGPELRARIYAVHEKHTRRLSDHGALTWFGQQCGPVGRGRTGRSVHTWTKMEQVPDGPHLVVLALLEVCGPRDKTLKRVRASLEAMP